MSEEKEEKKEAFLSRWSRLKRETETPPPAPAAGSQTTPVPAAELPPIESISLDTDIRPYLEAKVEESLKRMALKKLFHDPHFHFDNMDKLDTYIDDYSVADPLPESWLKELKFAQEHLFKDPTKPEALAEQATVPPESWAAAGVGNDAESGAVSLSPDPGAEHQNLEKMSHCGPEDDPETNSE